QGDGGRAGAERRPRRLDRADLRDDAADQAVFRRPRNAEMDYRPHSARSRRHGGRGGERRRVPRLARRGAGHRLLAPRRWRLDRVVMRRRDLFAFAGGALAWPLAAHGQQKPMPVIGLLGAAFPEDPAVDLNLQAFRQGLKETGFVEGQNVAIEYRWAHRDYERLPALAAELLARNVDVIVNEGGTPS